MSGKMLAKTLMTFNKYKLSMLAWSRRLPILLAIFFLGCKRNDVANKNSEYGLNVDIESLKRSPEVLLVIPDGFSGELRIIKDPRDGRRLTVETSRLVIEFPENGAVRVKDFAPLEKQHVLKAQYSSGPVLKVDPDASSSPSMEKSVWQIGSFRGTKYPLETLIFLVCSESERDSLARGLR